MAYSNCHRNYTNRIFLQMHMFRSIISLIDLCVLRDTSHDLFCIFGDFYASGTQEVTKSLQGLFALNTLNLSCLVLIHLFMLYGCRNRTWWGMEREKLYQRISGKYPSLSPLIDPTSQIDFMED